MMPMKLYWNVVHNGLNLKIGDFIYVKNDSKHGNGFRSRVNGFTVDVVQIGCIFKHEKGPFGRVAGKHSSG